MLKKFWIPVILCVSVILASCERGVNKGLHLVEKTYYWDPPTTEPPIEFPEITFENVLDLAPGEKYRLRPIDSHEDPDAEGFIFGVGWGSISEDHRLREGFTAADPKIRAWFSFSNPSTAGKVPYAQTLDGKPVIVKAPVWDEIVIEIVENPWGKSFQETGGPRGNRFEFTRVEYAAILIENLTHPDRRVEYE